MALEEDGMSPSDDSDLRSRVVYVEHRVQDHKSRLGALEGWQRAVDIAEATRTAEWKAMTEKLDDIRGTLKWLNRLVIGGIMAAVIEFVAGGGLNMTNLTGH